MNTETYVYLQAVRRSGGHERRQLGWSCAQQPAEALDAAQLRGDGGGGHVLHHGRQRRSRGLDELELGRLVLLRTLQRMSDFAATDFPLPI